MSLPSTYQEVEYIEFSGAQYITINEQPQINDILTLIGAKTAGTATDDMYCGARTGEYAGRWDISMNSGSDTYPACNNGASLSSAETLPDGNFQIVANMSFNGTYPAAFCVGKYYYSTPYYLHGRITSLVLTRSNVDVIALVPCYRIADSVIGFYETVDGVFYPNEGSGSFIKGPDVVPPADTYTIIFNAAGGSGSMSNQIVEVDQYDYLNACAYTKAGYSFIGWATSSGGPVAYLDGAQIYNLTEAEQSITLYAVWEREQLQLILQTNNSENNRANKDLVNVATVNFKLKEQTSITDPVFILQRNIADIIDANYITVPLFKRSYFITDIQSVRTGLVEVSAHVDVLSSYIEQLKTCSAIIHRQENKWNLYLDDGFFKTYQNPYIVVKKFPSGFTTQNFVLAVAGD